MTTITPGQYAIIRKREAYRILRLEYNQQYRIEKLCFKADGAFDQPLGSTFSASGKALTRCVADCEGELDAFEAECSGVDNRDMLDSFGSSQQLSQKDVLSLKANSEECDSKALIGKLVENSATFKQKTALTQDKYVRRKARKHCDIITILRPTIRLLSRVYYEKDAERIGLLRGDQLAMLLGAANVQAGLRMLILDDCLGLLAAAALGRMAGKGQCLHLHAGSHVQGIPALDAMNFTPEEMMAYFPLPIQEAFFEPSDATSSANGSLGKEEMVAASDGTERLGKRTADGASSANGELKPRKTPRFSSQLPGARESWRSGQFDGVLIAGAKYCSVEVLKATINKLAPSRPFAIHSMYSQPLIECYYWLRDTWGQAVNVTLLDSFFRRYQVLPERTHPLMTQNIAGGYILHGITIMDSTLKKGE